MRLRSEHIKYLSDKIILELLNSNFVKFNRGLEPAKKLIEEIIAEDIEFEKELNAKASEIVEEKEDDIEFYRVDRKQLFWMIKQRLAEEEGFNLKWEDRIGDLSHIILDELYENDLIMFHVVDNKIKNVIFKTIENYLKKQDEISEIVYEKMRNYKKKLIYGTEEFEIVYNKLYEEELRKLGL